MIALFRCSSTSNTFTVVPKIGIFCREANLSVKLRVYSHLKFIRRQLLCEIFSPHNCEKWVHNPLLNFSAHTKVDQIASVNAPTCKVQSIILQIVHAIFHA